MDKGTKLQAKGEMERGAGKAREALGKATGNEKQQARGKAQNAVGRVKDAAGGAVRKITK